MPSQLKKLKASLRGQGIIGPQQSKKQKKRAAQDGGAPNKRLEKRAALEGIREQYNPFDLKHNVRGDKFQVTSNRLATGNAAKGIQGRPTEAKAAGEERRRQTLLVEMQNRSKVGGIFDRRFGENDPHMTPEDKMMERFAREKMKSHKKSGMFDLEDDGPNEGFLTHGGQSLSLDGPALVDDYDEDDMDRDSDGDSNDEGKKAYLKRKYLSENGVPSEEDAEAEEGQPERKKTKQEVMKEVIAKSKMHKFQRQEAKDADEDLREELDQQLSSLQELLRGVGKDSKAPNAEEKEAIAAEKTRLEKEYDVRVRKLAQDRRAAPTERTKTEEEQAAEQSARLKELEDKRIRRMNGLDESESEKDEDDGEQQDSAPGPIQFMEVEEDDGFGLGQGNKAKTKTRATATELGFDDEDDFLVEDDLIASGSDVSAAEETDEDENSENDDSEAEVSEEDDDEFTQGLLNEQEKNPAFSASIGATSTKDDPDGLPYVFPCPQSHDELLQITKNVPLDKLPIVVQRIRAIYHPKLDAGNKAKMSNASRAFVQHLPYLASLPTLPPFSVLENLVRHIHSLAKSGYAVEIGDQLRLEIKSWGQLRPLSPTLPDLMVITCIATVFPTSDHFHQVVTPAMLCLARYLGQKVPQTLTDYTKGVYCSLLVLGFQQVSKRFVPELINFSLSTVLSLAPTKNNENLGFFPLHEPPPTIRIGSAKSTEVRKLSCHDCVQSEISDKDATSTKIAALDTVIQILDAAADTWTGKSSFPETFTLVSKVLAHLTTKPCRSELPAVLNERIKKSKSKIDSMIRLAQMDRKPLELHHHRPLPIRSNIPKFEDSFDPTKHYDPDRERAEMAKLKKEHKNERKGAMRELRKDANFMTREKLKVKRAKDEAYEKKYKRLVAEIQGEEGREANSYEREREQRKRANKRG